MTLLIDPNYYEAWDSLAKLGGGKVDGKEYDKQACKLKAKKARALLKGVRLTAIGGGGRVEHASQAAWLTGLLAVSGAVIVAALLHRKNSRGALIAGEEPLLLGA